jgi:arylformamidase
MEQRRGASVNVAAFVLSAHTGTHADAFLHAGAGADAASMPLGAYWGDAIVIDVSAKRGGAEDAPVRWSDLRAAFDTLRKSSGPPPRLLLRTGRTGSTLSFPRAFRPIAEDLARNVARAGVPLLGTDAPSVDAFASKDLPIHRRLAEGGVAILENLDLSKVPEGRYELVAAPLRFVGADASPVRALLRAKTEPGSSRIAGPARRTPPRRGSRGAHARPKTRGENPALRGPRRNASRGDSRAARRPR